MKLGPGDFDVRPPNPEWDARNENNLASYAIGLTSVALPELVSHILGTRIDGRTYTMVSFTIGAGLYGVFRLADTKIDPWYVLAGGLTYPIHTLMRPALESLSHIKEAGDFGLQALSLGLSGLTSFGVSKGVSRIVEPLLR